MNIYKDHINTLKQLPVVGQSQTFQQLLTALQSYLPESVIKSLEDLNGQLSQIEGNLPTEEKIRNVFGTLTDQSVLTQRGLAGVDTVITTLGTKFQGAAKESLKLEQRYANLGKTFKTNISQAGKFGLLLDQVGVSLEVGGEGAQALAASISDIVPGLAGGAENAQGFVQELIRAQKVQRLNLQLTEEQSKSIELYAALQGRSGTNQLEQLALIGQAIEQNTDYVGVFAEITGEIGSLSSDVRAQFGRIPGNLELSILKSKQFGASFSDIAKTGRSLLNIEESVNKQLEFQLVSGIRLEENGKNLIDTYRTAFVSGDAEGMADAQRAILEQSGDIVEKNFAAREALAGLLGVSEDALLKQVEQLRLTKQLQAKGIELDLTLENDKLVDAIENARSQIDSGDKETAKLLDSFAETAEQRTTEELLIDILDVLKTTPVTTAFDTPGDIQKNIQDASKAVLDVETALKDALAALTTGVTQAQLQVAGGVGLGVDAIQLIATTIKQGFKGLFDDNAFNNSTFRTDILNVSADSMQKRALGGPVASGIPYIVGEVGPEVFVPSENGTIIPNNQLAASGGSPISVDIDYNRLAAAMANIRLTVESAPEGINMA